MQTVFNAVKASFTAEKTDSEPEKKPPSETVAVAIASILSPAFLQYLKSYHRQSDYLASPRRSSFEIDDLALSVGKFYEKVRQVIDWKEESELRRGAILRGLKRHLVGEVYSFVDSNNRFNTRLVTETLVVELMHSGYFDNDRIDDNKVADVEAVLGRTLRLLGSHPIGKNTKRGLKAMFAFRTWLLEIAACEVEDILTPQFDQDALVEFMNAVFLERLKFKPKNILDELTLKKLLDIAVRKSLYNADNAWLTYNLIRKFYPEWFDKKQADNLPAFRHLTDKIRGEATSLFKNKNGLKILRLTNKYSAVWRLIDDLMAQIDPKHTLSIKELQTAFADQDKVAAGTQALYEKRRKTLKSRLLRSCILTTLSLLVAGSAMIFIVEIPIANLIGQGFSPLAFTVDLFVPVALVFFLTFIIQPPKKSNEPLVIREVKGAIFKSDVQPTYTLRLRFTRLGKIFNLIFFTLQIVFGVGGLIGLAYLFYIAGLPYTSIFLNSIDILMALFAAGTVRHSANEITIEENDNLLTLLMDAITLPMAKVGQFLAKKWKEYNIVAIFFSALVDMPFSAIISFIEDWRIYLKEKKSELSA